MFTTSTGPTRGLQTDNGIRCARCHKLLAEKASRPWRITCVRCGHTNNKTLRDEPPPAADAEPIREASVKPPLTPKRRRRRSRSIST